MSTAYPVTDQSELYFVLFRFSSVICSSTLKVSGSNLWAPPNLSIVVLFHLIFIILFIHIWITKQIGDVSSDSEVWN